MDPFSQEYHQWYGKHSGIPQCCIDYFCKYIDCGYPYPWTKRDSEHVGYVQCNECRENGNIVEVHRCTEECAIHHPILQQTLFRNIYQKT